MVMDTMAEYGHDQASAREQYDEVVLAVGQMQDEHGEEEEMEEVGEVEEVDWLEDIDELDAFEFCNW